MTKEPVAAIVVAAGSGVRLGGSTAGGIGPKALRTVQGKTLVARSVAAMAAGGATFAVVVMPVGAREQFERVLADAPIPVTLVEGGATRQESVYRGITALTPSPCHIVLIHDAARPLVPASVVTEVIDTIRSGAKAAIPVVPLADSIRCLDEQGSVVVNRDQLRAVQTPQGFDLHTLIKAHEAAVGQEYTDDAAVCEAYGANVVLVPGSRRSLKITDPADFAFAEALLEDGHEDW